MEADKGALKALVDLNERITTWEVVERLNLLNSTFMALEKPRFKLEARHIFSSQTSKKLSVFEEHHHCERKMDCL